jgi:predicted TIM-barrel fold metal-dependent hydrolase
MLCDVHCHFFSTGFLENLATSSGRAGADAVAETAGLLGWELPGTPEALAERWAAELDRQGVARAALIASVPGDEASVATAVALHPGRFVGFFVIDPTASDAETRTAAALRDLGLRVPCLFPALHRYPLSSVRVQRVAAIAASMPGTALFVHCGVLSIGARRRLGIPDRLDFRYANPLDLQSLALAHPQLPIVVPHFGAGFLREALIVADHCPNVHLDTSSSNSWLRYHPGLTLEAVFAQALEVAGPDRLLFGTDSSFFPRGWQRQIYERQRAALDAIGAPVETREKVLGENFARLFPVKE